MSTMSTADLLVEQMFSWIDQRERCAEQLKKLAPELESISRDCVSSSMSVARAGAMIGSGGSAALLFGIAVGGWSGAGLTASVATKIIEDFISSDTMKEAQRIEEKSNRITEEIQKLFEKLNAEVMEVSSLTDPDEVERCVVTEILRAVARRSGVNLQINYHMFYDVQLFFQQRNMEPNLPGLFGILGFFALKVNGIGTQLLFAEGLKQLIRELSSAGVKTALKGGAMVVGGAVGLAFALSEAIDNWKDLINNNRVTEASQSLRDTADEILQTCRTLRGQFDDMKRMLVDMEIRQREHERQERERHERRERERLQQERERQERERLQQERERKERERLQQERERQERERHERQERERLQRERERQERERLQQERERKERERLQQEHERQERERLQQERERKERERLQRECERQERERHERQERERLQQERERKERERLQQERERQERERHERQERERLQRERERQERERLQQERERKERERLQQEHERQERERLQQERERQERERLQQERERKERERLQQEHERQERERLQQERERKERERLQQERERKERERLQQEHERQERERLQQERERKERERHERQERERLQRERERKERERHERQERERLQQERERKERERCQREHPLLSTHLLPVIVLCLSLAITLLFLPNPPAQERSGNQMTYVEPQRDQSHEDEQNGVQTEQRGSEQETENQQNKQTGSDQQGGGDQADEEWNNDDEERDDEDEERDDEEEESESEDEESDSEEETEEDEGQQTGKKKRRKYNQKKETQSKERGRKESEDVVTQDGGIGQDQKKNSNINEEGNQESDNNQRSGSIKVGLHNVRSMRKNATRIREIITENNLDVFATTETWLNGNAEDTLRRASPENFSYAYSLREGRGGGVAIQFSNELQHKEIRLNTDITTFEYVAVPLQHDEWNQPILFINVYLRPNYTMTPFGVFLNEFEELLKEVSKRFNSIVVTGDFNIQKKKRYTEKFGDLLKNNGFVQHVDEPTHVGNNTLDLVITRGVQISDLSVQNVSTEYKKFDHYLITFTARPEDEERGKRKQEQEQRKKRKKG